MEPFNFQSLFTPKTNHIFRTEDKHYPIEMAKTNSIIITTPLVQFQVRPAERLYTMLPTLVKSNPFFALF